MTEPQPTQDEGAGSDLKETRSLNDLFSTIYEELRRLASSVRRNEVNATLNSTALVHEAWMRLRDSPQLAATSPLHFKRIAARVMRQVLVDAARERKAGKRGGSNAVRVPLDESIPGMGGCEMELLALNEALDRLAEMDLRQAEVAELRIFSELTNPEIATELGVHLSTVERSWKVAKAWLKTQLGTDPQPKAKPDEQ